MKQNTVSHISPRRRSGLFYLLMGMLIPALTMVTGFIVLGIWPFGDGTILKVDCLHQYLPFFTDFHEKLRSGDSLFYSFSGGLGYDFWSTYAYYLASPLNWLIVLVPKANVCDFMDVMILLKVSACGGIFSWYLHRRNSAASFLPLVFGTMYAMGNFYIGYNFNIMWLDSMAVVPLIMYGIERLVKGKGRGGYIYGLSLFYGLWCNYYIGFMLCIFSCLYLLVCLVCAGEGKPHTFRKGSGDCHDTEQIRAQAGDPLKDQIGHSEDESDGQAPDGRKTDPGQKRSSAAGGFFRTILSFAWYSLLAGGMSALVLLPAYRSLTSSESMLSNSFPTHLRFYTDFLSMYMSHLVNAKPITISDSQVGFNAYCGTIVPLLVICYVMERRIRLRERIAHLCLAGILFASVTVNYLNYMWHGFHTQNGLPNRFVFLYVLIVLLLAFDVLSRIRGFDLRFLLAAGAAAFGLTLAVILTKETGENWAGGIFVVLPLIMLSIYLALLLILVALRPRQKIFSAVLGVLMLLEASAHGVYGMCENGRVTRSIYLKDQASYQALMAAQGDDTFYRSEIDSQRMRNVTIFAGGHSTVLFNSTMSEAMTHFCDRIGMEARTNKNGYNGVTRLMNDVLGVKYVLATIGKGDRLYQFPKIDKDDNLSLYYNENALSLGFVVNEDILEWDIDEGTPIGVQNSFAKLAADVDKLYVLDRTVDASDGEKVEVKVPDDKQVYLYLPEKVDNFSLNTPEYHREYATYNDHLYTMNSLGEENIGDFTCDLKPSQDTVQVNIYTCPDAACQQVHDALAESQLEDVTAFGAQVTGNLSSKKDGILLITLPYDEDWTIWLDGEKTQAECIGSALIGVPVTQGEHTLRMRFVPNGFYTGLLISLVSLALMIASILVSLRGRRRLGQSSAGQDSESAEAIYSARTLSDNEESDYDSEAQAIRDMGRHVWPLNWKAVLAGITSEENSWPDTDEPGKRETGEAKDAKDAKDAEETKGLEKPDELKGPDDHEHENGAGTGEKMNNTVKAEHIIALEEMAGIENVLRNEPMSAHTTFRIGGNADVLVAPPDEESLLGVMRYLREEGVPFYVIGNGSNLLVGDKGFRGVIVQVYKNLADVQVEGNRIHACAGAMLSTIARAAYTHGLTGLEFASGIPGTLGGAVVMNAGAYGGEMKDVIDSVRVLDSEGSVRTIPASKMGFGYRTSCVTGEGFLVLGASFTLQEGDPEKILERMQELKEQRTSKQPLDKPSAGSTFKRPEGNFAGKLIMEAGLKGYTVGGACVSEKHAGFVVNNGGATARDVRDVIAHVQDEVERQFGIRLECEIRMIGEF